MGMMRAGAKAPPKKPPPAPKQKAAPPAPKPQPKPPKAKSEPKLSPQPSVTSQQPSEASTSEPGAAPWASPAKPRPPYQDTADYRPDKLLSTALAARDAAKPSLHVVVLGHVDAGKSTLMGRLVADLGFVDARTVHKTQQEAQNAGRGSFGWAWAFDEREEERLRGVTIDVSTRHIETARCALQPPPRAMLRCHCRAALSLSLHRSCLNA